MADPNVVANPAAGAAGNEVVDPAKDPSAQPGAKNQPGEGQKQAVTTKFEYPEDRSQWVPRHVIEERARKAAEKASKETEARFQAELEARDKRIRALAGVDPQDPKAEEDARVRAELERMYPWMKGMSQERLEKLEALLANAEGLERTQMSVHERHAESMVVQVENEVEEAIGKELTPKQRRTLRREYADAAEECQWARQNDPAHDASNDFLTRHDRGDKALAKEVAEGFMKDWIEPVRRKVANDAVNQRRPMPSGRRGQPMVTQPVKVDLTKPGAFEEAMAAARREEGRGYRE